jgi:general stress protein 26
MESLMAVRRLALSMWIVSSTLACSTSAPSRSPDDTAAAPAAAVPAIPPASELYRTLEPAVIVDSARSLMRADSSVALVTIDSTGQPRVRTVRAFVDPPDASNRAGALTVWIMTRLTTRKVEQMRANPRVTLYFNDDAKLSYATIMGTATVHTDPEHPGAKRHYDAEYARFFWPKFPEDFVMIEVKARWLEHLGPGIPAHDENWRPQAVTFAP